MELRTVTLTSLDLVLGRLRLLPEAVIARMADSMRRQGQLTPIVATERDGALVLVDGFVRHAAAERVGLTELLVEVVTLDDVQMKVQLYLRNRERGLLLLEECRLVHELNRADGLSQVEISELLERHKSWVSRRLSLCRALSPHLRDDGSLHRLGSGSVRRLASLPHRNQDEVVAIVQREQMGPQNARIFIDLWARATDSEARNYLCEQPMEAIRLAKEGRHKAQLDPRVGQAGQVVLDQLLAIEQSSLRILARIRRGVVPLSQPGATSVVVALRRASDRSHAAFDAIGQWVKS